MKNMEKLWHFKTKSFKSCKKVIEFYFTNLCIIELYLIRSWICVLLIPATFEFIGKFLHTFIEYSM